jgi:hypothetical protein
MTAMAATRVVTVRYRAHDGQGRPAYVLLPTGVRPDNAQPLPLVISPHGRGVDALVNTHLWGDLPGQYANQSGRRAARRQRTLSATRCGARSPGARSHSPGSPADLVEHRRPNRRQPSRPIRSAVPADQTAQSRRTRNFSHRDLGSLNGNDSLDPPSRSAVNPRTDPPKTHHFETSRSSVRNSSPGRGALNR